MFYQEPANGSPLPHHWHSRTGNTQVVLLLVLGSLVTLGLALALGASVADGQYRLLGLLFLVTIAGAIFFIFRQNIWIFMLAAGGFTGTIPLIPLPFSVAQYAIIMTVAFFMVFLALKVVPPMAKAKPLDYLLWLNLGYLLTVFIRNPAGVRFLQTDRIGAKAYAVVVLAVFAYWVLQHFTASPKLCYRLPLIMASSAILAGILLAVTTFFPVLGYQIFPIYSGVATNETLWGPEERDFSETRQQYGATLGDSLGLLLASYYNPVTLAAFGRPLLAPLLYLSGFLVLISGFRSGLVSWVYNQVGSAYFRQGIGPVIIALSLTLLAYLGIAAAVSSGVAVPLPIQRALSFLPGPWEEKTVADAVGSWEWRLEMWQEALTSPRYIKNKFLGDGFGFDQAELWALVNVQDFTGGDSRLVQEYFMIIGAYHSGPVSTIRYAGVVGLILITLLMIWMARQAWELITQTKNTVFFPLALYIGLPIIYKPFAFWFLFGAFENDLPFCIMGVAMLNLLSRSVEKEKFLSTSMIGTAYPFPQPSAVRAEGRFATR